MVQSHLSLQMLFFQYWCRMDMVRKTGETVYLQIVVDSSFETVSWLRLKDLCVEIFFEELSSLKDERLNRYNVPKVPNVTRWFGQLSMLKTFQKVEHGMKLHIANSSAMKPLSAIDWRNCQGYIDIHFSFFISTQFISTLGCKLPIFYAHCS